MVRIAMVPISRCPANGLEIMPGTRNHGAMPQSDRPVPGLPDPLSFEYAGLVGLGDDAVRVALVVPMQGPAGMFGPTGELCAQLATEEVNRAGGVLGRELRLI